jgi:mono/diheme cytochrome c family protein
MKKGPRLEFLLVVAILFASLGVLSFGQKTEGGQKGSNEKTAGERNAGNPVKATPSSIEAGKKLFSDKCEECHGEKADGTSELATTLNPKPANLTDSRGVGKLTDKEVFDWITRGKNTMPQFPDLPEEARWNVVNFIRSVEARNSEGGKDAVKKN